MSTQALVITPVATSVKEDRRAKFKAAAVRLRSSFSAEFRQLDAEEIMNFIWGDEPVKSSGRRGRCLASLLARTQLHPI